MKWKRLKIYYNSMLKVISWYKIILNLLMEWKSLNGINKWKFDLWMRWLLSGSAKKRQKTIPFFSLRMGRMDCLSFFAERAAKEWNGMKTNGKNWNLFEWNGARITNQFIKQHNSNQQFNQRHLIDWVWLLMFDWIWFELTKIRYYNSIRFN